MVVEFVLACHSHMSFSSIQNTALFTQLSQFPQTSDKRFLCILPWNHHNIPLDLLKAILLWYFAGTPPSAASFLEVEQDVCTVIALNLHSFKKQMENIIVENLMKMVSSAN